MNGATTITKPRLALQAVRLDADVIALTVTAAVVGALAIVTWGTWGDLGRDTGYDFVAASRVAHGQLPYSDFVYYYGPLAPFALGLAALVAGSGVTTFVSVGLVLAYAIIAATYALARTQTTPLGAALAATATGAIALSPTNVSYVAPHTYSATFAILLSLLFLLGLSAASDGRRYGLFGAGVAAGLVALTRPEFEAAVVATAVVWLVTRARSGRNVRSEAVTLTAVGLLVPAAVYGSFLAAISPRRLFLENLYPVDTLRAGGSAIVRSQAPLTVHSVLIVGGYLALYAVGAAVLVAVARLLQPLPARLSYLLIGSGALVLLGLAAWDPEAVRSRLQWIFGGVPAAAVAAVALLLVQHAVRRRPLDADGQTLLATLTLLAVLAAKTYHGFFFLAERAQPAVYAAPFVFVALMRLHLRELARSRTALTVGAAWLATLTLVCLGLTIKDARAQPTAVTGPGGTLRVSTAEAPLYRAAVGAIESGSPAGAPILLAPQLTALYTLTGRTDPLPEISLLPGALPDAAAERAAVARLERSGVAVVVTDRHRFPEYDQTAFGGSFDRIVASWIRRHFKHTATLRGGAAVDHTLDVWMRRTP